MDRDPRRGVRHEDRHDTICDFAPAPSTAEVRDILPSTTKAPLNPEPIFEAPTAISSWLASTSYPYFVAKERAIATDSAKATRATPIVAALTVSSVGELELEVKRTAMTLGASPFQALTAVARESRYALLVAFSAGFGRVIAEVGSAMMLGGNIRGYTRTMTTAIALETGKGEFGLGIALGIVLLLVALSINLIVQVFSERIGEARG